MDRRYSSQPSVTTVSSNYGFNSLQDMCRICHCEGEPDFPLISPCYCSGSLRYVHQSCLQQWIKSSDTQCCELCKFYFIMHTKIKPFRKWKKLEMSPDELCAVRFLVVITTFLVLGLYIVIEETAKKMPNMLLEWQFWIQLIVVAIGIMGTLVFFTHALCKTYFRRWRAYNKIIYVQNAPLKRGMTQMQQQQAAAFSTAAQLTASVLTNEETKQLSPDEDEFRSCQSGSNSTSNSHNGSSNSINVDNTKDTSSKMPTAETGSIKTTLTSMMDSGLVSIADHNHPLNEVVVMSTAADTVFCAGEENSLPFLSRQLAEDGFNHPQCQDLSIQLK